MLTAQGSGAEAGHPVAMKHLAFVLQTLGRPEEAWVWQQRFEEPGGE
ncbi:hypothetical protein AB0N05_36500 [Nocardia sp. NPDC051030]